METQKPRVVIDARMVGPHGHGIANYVVQLAEGIAARELSFEPCFLIHSSCPPDSLLRALPHAECEIPFLHPRELLSLGAEIARLEPALYHSPSFASLLHYPCPHLQTVHDLNHLHFGGWKEKAYYRLVLLPSLRRAAGVFSVSQTAAREIESWLDSHGMSRKVAVAANSILPFPVAEDEQAALASHGLRSGDYFFVLSNPKPHKNLDFLTAAYSAARARQAEMPPLVLSVKGTFEPGILRIGPFSDREIGTLLKNARAFFFPSLYEGFGRPPLEAALMGTPPWVSDIPVHREALSGVAEARFLPLGDPEAWIRAFLESAAGGQRVSEAGRSWIRETYSVARLAETMDHAYRRALGQET